MDMFNRADEIERLVTGEFGDKDQVAYDFALHELSVDATRSNQQIADLIAYKTMQS